MALALDPARIVAPLSPEDPCGGDLDEAGDLDFLNDVSRIEGLLPAAFFSRDDEGRQQPFDRSRIDFGRENKALLALLDRTRDLRLLVLLARLAMLDRDLPGFAAALAAVAGLLEAQWEGVHPRGEGGAYDLRSAVLQSLDDLPTVVLPLQHVVLFQSRRLGPITFRSVMVADREVPGREDEPTPDRAAILRALEEADPDTLRPLVDSLAAIGAEAARIAAATAERGGYASAVRLERLEDLTARIHQMLASAVAGAGRAAAGAADPAEAAAPSAAGPGPASGTGARVASAADASAALAAAALYLRLREPSSPAEVLVRQAQVLVGKSFIEVMRILMPAQAADAVVAVGASRGLRLTFDQLASVPEEVAEGPADDAREAQEGWGAPEGESAPPLPPMTFQAATRSEATALLREAAAFFRAHEPSSPIPLLLDKAVGMADRDFLTILRDVLPDVGPEA